jgi:hypothetical protein
VAGPAAKAALDKPELSVAIKYDDGKKEDRVAFGRSGGSAFASRAGENAPVAVAPATIDGIAKAIEGLK